MLIIRMHKRIFVLILLVLLSAMTITTVYIGIYGGPGVKLPVLVYHNFSENSRDIYTVSGKKFRNQLKWLKTAGYSAVTVQEVIDYVEKGTSLPKNPIIITIDDGYEGVLSVAAPILEEVGFCATVFVVGILEGEKMNPYTNEPMVDRHFSLEEAQNWVDKGIIDIQSHTYDMHHLETYGTSNRNGMLAIENERREDYFAAISADCKAFGERIDGKIDTDLVALAYTYGYYTDELDTFLESEGIKATFTVNEHINILEKNNSSSLRKMGRINVIDDTSGTILVLRLLKNRIFS